MKIGVRNVSFGDLKEVVVEGDSARLVSYVPLGTQGHLATCLEFKNAWTDLSDSNIVSDLEEVLYILENLHKHDEEDFNGAINTLQNILEELEK